MQGEDEPDFARPSAGVTSSARGATTTKKPATIAAAGARLGSASKPASAAAGQLLVNRCRAEIGNKTFSFFLFDYVQQAFP